MLYEFLPRYRSLLLDLVRLLIHMPIERIDRCLNIGNLLSFLIGDIHSHILLHGDNKLHRIQRIEAQLLEGGGLGEFGLIALCGAFEDFEDFGLDHLEQLGLGFGGAEAEAQGVLTEDVREMGEIALAEQFTDHDFVGLILQYTQVIFIWLHEMSIIIIVQLTSALMLLRRLIRYRMSEDEQKFRGAQAIMLAILDYPSESKRVNTQNPRAKLEDPDKVVKQGLILTDRISSVIRSMQAKKLITSQRVVKSLVDVFDPKIGMEMSKQIIVQQQNRYWLGVGQNLFAINYNTVMMSFVLNQMYTITKQGNFTNRSTAPQVQLIVGTPGLGKTFKFLGAKFLQDLRIPYLMSRSTPLQDSPFARHYKFFYITARTPPILIMENMYLEIEKDFNYSPPEYLAKIRRGLKENYWNFIQSTVSAYRDRNIRVRFIVDQINEVYSEYNDVQRSDIGNNLRYLAYHSQRPVIMISSKNNPYLSYKIDPVLYSANSSRSSPGHVKTILDNEITITERLGYTTECLIFQLQKEGLTRGLAIEIAQKISLPLLTHLEITQIVQKFMENSKKKILAGPKIDLCIKELQRQIHQNFVQKGAFVKNINNLIQSFMEEKSPIQQMNYSALMICGILSLNSKRASQKTVQSTIKIYNGTKEEEVNKKIEITVRQIDQNNQNSLLHLVKDSNYFFTCKINGKRFMVISLPLIDALDLRLFVSSNISHELVTKLIKYVPIESYKLFKDSIGIIFELYICSIYNQAATSKWEVNTTLKFHGQTFEHTLKKPTAGVDHRSNCGFEIANHQNPAYDLCLTKVEGSKASLVLIDTTISDRTDNIRQKLFSAKNKLKKSQNFNALIDKWKNTQNIQQIDILYCVLMGKIGEQILYQNDALNALKTDLDLKLAQALRQNNEDGRDLQGRKGKQEVLEGDQQDLVGDKDKQQEQKSEKSINKDFQEKDKKQTNNKIRVLQQHKRLLQKQSSAQEDLIKQSNGKIKSIKIRAGVFGQHMQFKEISGRSTGYKQTIDALMSIHRQINKK